MNVADIRRTFLQFFESQGHSRVASSSLVPGNDPTLLFTNSGMVQFKDVFLGVETRPYRRATSAQRCVRAGGKHNDLENVGYTARHHTFFEMLGNFSFGDYFKRDAIHFAWTLLTRDLKLPAQKLWVTVYHNDDEAYRLWADEIGVPPERIVRIGDNKGAPYASDNFWQMADTGPCGPCSEVFYDHGPEVAGGPPGSPDADGDRYIEIWNLVFMQYDRDAQGVLHPLPKPCVDTGMGLERVAAVLQGVHSNYEIDLFRHLIEAAAQATHTDDIHHDSLKVIADHIRACAFLLIDGVIPSNEGRGYVLRRIIRRALRHGHKLGCDTPFFHTLIPALAEQMGDAYPELRAQADRLAQTLLAEEKRFGETLDKGMGLLNEAIARLEAAATNPNAPLVLDGATVFTLYDTFGFPVDLTADILRERNIGFDEPGFDVAMARQRQQAKAASRFKSATALSYQGAPTAFVGYDRLTQESEVIALYVDGVAAEQAHSGDNVVVVLSDTPFYAESGGQVGDAGELTNNQCHIDIHDTQKIQAGVFGHHGVVRQGSLDVGQRITATVNGTQRAAAARNHSATHLLHAALRAELGLHVQQKGSLVDAERTRFDFSHPAPLAPEQLQAIEMRVNQAIQRNAPVAAQLMPYDQALQAGALALFGEKYGDEVRVIGMDDLSTELCGGTHVQRTGDIGLFKVLSESGVAAGIRRIEATTGSTALAQVQALDRQWHTLARNLKTPPAEVPARVATLLEQLRQLTREHEQLKSKLAAGQGNDLRAQAVEMGDVQVLAVALDNADAKTLRTTLDQLKSQWPRCVVVLAGVENDSGRVALVAGVSDTLTTQFKAGELVNFVAQQVGGKGGGRADMAMAGGTNAAALPEALKNVAAWVRERL